MKELNEKELKAINGGIWQWVLGSLAYELLADGPAQCGKDFASGFADA